jgi:hypothetical protein
LKCLFQGVAEGAAKFAKEIPDAEGRKQWKRFSSSFCSLRSSVLSIRSFDSGYGTGGSRRQSKATATEHANKKRNAEEAE